MRQAYAMIKHRSFGHTRAFDPELLEKIGLQEAGPEGKNLCSHNLSLNHSNTRLEVRHGSVPALLSGHGRPQGIGPPALVPVDPDLLQTFSFVQRFRHSDLADGRAEHVHQQHRRVTRPAHRVNSELVAIHRREDPQLGAATAADPGGVEGLLPLG